MGLFVIYLCQRYIIPPCVNLLADVLIDILSFASSPSLVDGSFGGIFLNLGHFLLRHPFKYSFILLIFNHLLRQSIVEGCDFFKPEWHHGLMFSNFVLSWMLLFISLGAYQPPSLLIILFAYYSSIRTFCSHILTPELFFCTFVFKFFSPTCWKNFLSLFWKEHFKITKQNSSNKFCMYCFVLPRYRLILTSLSTTFCSISSNFIVSLVCCLFSIFVQFPSDDTNFISYHLCSCMN